MVCYFSAEFLMGPHLENNLINLGIYEQVRQACLESGLDLQELIGHEAEPGLGNGGLGRLAACYLDSLATLEAPAIGYGIRYEYGIFKQSIRDGWQAEQPDTGLRFYAVNPGNMRTALFQRAYPGAPADEVPPPAVAAEAFARLLSGEGDEAGGSCLDAGAWLAAHQRL